MDIPPNNSPINTVPASLPTLVTRSNCPPAIVPTTPAKFENWAVTVKLFRGNSLLVVSAHLRARRAAPRRRQISHIRSVCSCMALLPCLLLYGLAPVFAPVGPCSRVCSCRALLPTIFVLCLKCLHLGLVFDPPLLLVCLAPKLGGNWGDRAFVSAAPRLWNSLPSNLKMENTYELFKTKLKGEVQ